jgi:hypothetical protein
MGGSGSHFLSINGRQHIGKCPTKSNGPWVCFNEFLAARLATKLELPIPPFQLVQFQGPLGAPEQWFCSERLLPGANPVPASWGRLVNGEALGAIAIFDIWLCNCDRSPTNLWAQRVATDREKLFIIDHGHTLLTTGELDSLAGRDLGGFLGCANLVNAITNVNDLARAMEALTALPESVIVETVTECPSGWVPDAGVLDRLTTFLLKRREAMGGMIEANLTRFPGIGRGSR